MSSSSPSAVTEHVVRTPDGLALFVRDYAAEAPITGLPVLCLHGLTRNSRDFSGVAPRIAALGRRVICPDVRGRGRSDWDPKPENYQAPIYVQDTLGILDQLGVERCVWVGTSMGGLMTMVAAALAPARIAAVVLNDVGPQLDQRGLDRIAGYVGRTEPVADLDAAATAIRAINQPAFPMEADHGFWRTFAERTFRKRPDGRFELDYDPAIALPFKAAPAPAPDLWPVFAALGDIPTLVVRGALSDLIAPETIAAMKDRKPDLETVTVDDVGHAPTLEEEIAWTALWRFLSRTP
jgi:pimeloyl-ACP methyl ester carboxylesterase